MPEPIVPTLGRRAFLGAAGAGCGLLLARGLGVRGLLAPEHPASFEEALQALARSLTSRQRELVVFPADHPTRQITNTVSIVDRPHLGTLLSPEQRERVVDLYHAMLSPRGRAAFAGTVAVEGRLDGGVLALYGEPEQGRGQAVIMGGHLMLRRGDSGPGGAAFGGGTAYGHQIGNHRWKVEGNAFAFHGDAANRLFGSLDAAERARAIQPVPPHELVLQAQGADGRFAGVRFGSLSESAASEAEALLTTVFSSYPEAELARARACIDANGGVQALHFACYATHGFYRDGSTWEALGAAERARRVDPYWQVWRVEGPGTVIHFQGYPHVHGYVNVVREPGRANVGESLGATPAIVDGEPMRRLLEAALRRATGEALAHHGDAPGRFCPGEVTTGLAYSLDPYANHVAVAEIEGRAMAEPLRQRLAASGVAPEPRRRYRVATTTWYASEEDEFGKTERIEVSDTLLRDALVEHLRAGGLADARA